MSRREHILISSSEEAGYKDMKCLVQCHVLLVILFFWGTPQRTVIYHQFSVKLKMFFSKRSKCIIFKIPLVT